MFKPRAEGRWTSSKLYFVTILVEALKCCFFLLIPQTCFIIKELNNFLFDLSNQYACALFKRAKMQLKRTSYCKAVSMFFVYKYMYAPYPSPASH